METYRPKPIVIMAKSEKILISMISLILFVMMFSAERSFSAEDDDLIRPIPAHYLESFTLKEPSDWLEITDAAEKSRTLDFLYESCELNYTKLKTWIASYRFLSVSNQSDQQNIDDVSREDKPVEAFLVETTGQVEFKIDFTSDQVNWDFKCESIKPLAQKEHSLNLLPETLSAQYIFGNTHFIRLAQDALQSVRLKELPGYEVKKQRVAKIEPGENYCPSPYTPMSDPHYFFCSIRGKDWFTYWSPFKKIAACLSGSEGDELYNRFQKEYRCYTSAYDGKTWYKVEQVLENFGKNAEYLFSESSGFNLEKVSYFDDKGSVTTAVTWKYIDDNGLKIPEQYIFFNNAVYLDWTLQSSSVNKSISEQEFTLSGLNGRENDLVLCDRDEEVLIYHKGQFVHFAKYGETPPSLAARDVQGHPYIGVLFLLTGLILVVFSLIKMYIRKKEKVCQ